MEKLLVKEKLILLVKQLILLLTQLIKTKVQIYMMHRSGGIDRINEKTYANILRIPIKIINN